MHVIMYVKVVTPGRTRAAGTLLRAHAHALHVQVSTAMDFSVIIDICQFSSYHVPLIATLLIIRPLTY